MKRLIGFIVLIVIFTSGCTVPDGPLPPRQEYDGPIEVSESSLRLDIGEENPTLFEGIGVQWDNDFWLNKNQAAGLTEEDWQLIVDRVVEMRFDTIRIKVLPTWYELQNDNDDPFVLGKNLPPYILDFNTKEMKALYKILDVCEQNGINVNLSVYGAPVGSWLAVPVTGQTHWIVAPFSYDEFSENVSMLLDYLINKKGYGIIDELSVYPECDAFFSDGKGKFNFTQYCAMINNLNERLTDDGLRDKIRLSGPADTMNEQLLLQTMDVLGDVFDVFSSSCYEWNMTSTDAQIDQKLSARMDKLKDELDAKPYKYAEFGSNLTVDATSQQDTDTYERGVFLARVFAASLNNNVSGINYWVLHDMYYNSFMMKLGLWKFKDNNWEARSQYYAWSLLTRYTESGSSVYSLSESKEKFSAVALKSPSGKWTYVAVNSSNEDIDIAIVNEKTGYPQSMRYFEYSEGILPSEVKIISSSRTLDTYERAAAVTVPANSFVLLTDYTD